MPSASSRQRHGLAPTSTVGSVVAITAEGTKVSGGNISEACKGRGSKPDSPKVVFTEVALNGPVRPRKASLYTPVTHDAEAGATRTASAPAELLHIKLGEIATTIGT